MSAITRETAVVYRGGGRRFFSRKAAERAAAKSIIKRRCECSRGDHITPPEICDWHKDQDRFQRAIHLLIVMFIRRAEAAGIPVRRVE